MEVSCAVDILCRMGNHDDYDVNIPKLIDLMFKMACVIWLEDSHVAWLIIAIVAWQVYCIRVNSVDLTASFLILKNFMTYTQFIASFQFAYCAFMTLSQLNIFGIE